MDFFRFKEKLHFLYINKFGTSESQIEGMFLKLHVICSSGIKNSSTPRLNISRRTLCYLRKSLRETCLCLEFLCSVFFRIRTEYGDLQSKSPYSVRIRENTDQKNSEY